MSSVHHNQQSTETWKSIEIFVLKKKKKKIRTESVLVSYQQNITDNWPIEIQRNLSKEQKYVTEGDVIGDGEGGP